jgi:hypothetical protein
VQFRYINEQVKAHQGSGDPVISVDTKKKELVGEFKNTGREWRPKGQPVATRAHDFPGDSLGKAVPYGVYDITGNTAGSMWVPIMTPPRSPWSRSAAGGSRPGAAATP